MHGIDPVFPLASIIPFARFNQKYRGQSCTIVGRGPTDFDYRDLARSPDPVFFINDAVCLENHAAGETFFFAHDPQALAWLDGAIRSTAVLPLDGKIFRDSPGIRLHHPGGLVLYRWREKNKEDLLLLTRDQVADLGELYTHTGTIHSVLHFIWFCGFNRVRFIGCDGITDTSGLPVKFQTSDGYDPRLKNLSQSKASPTYPTIFHVQQLLTNLFSLEAEYVGKPGGRGAGGNDE